MVGILKNTFVFVVGILATSFIFAAAPKNSSPFSKDSKKARFISELKEPTLVDFVEKPQIRLPSLLLKESEWPKEFKESDSEQLKKILELQKEGDFSKAYVQADKFLTKNKNSPLTEWVQLLKADLMFQVQDSKNDGKYSDTTEEYQDFIREYPLNTQNPRVLYQIALSQLRQGFSEDVESTVARAIKDYGQSQLIPFFHLILGEQAFLSRNDLKANYEFSLIIQKYPEHPTSVDAAFRKAFIVFRKGDFAQALKVYEDLARFHSKDFEKLTMKSDAQDRDTFADRVVYAESVYQTGNYKDAARLFQDLANIFPTDKAVPFLLMRLGDTYLQRGYYPAAAGLYEDVRDRFKADSTAFALAGLKLGDAYFVYDPLDSSKHTEKLYLESYQDSVDAKNDLMASLSLAKVAAFHIYHQTYLKAKQVLKTYRQEFKETLNQAWIDSEYAKIIELEIQDYYEREDYLAALATYLVSESQQADQLKDTPILLKLSDASIRLGLLDKSAQILNRVVYLDKTQAGRQEALLKLVDISIRKGELKKASERLRRFNFAYPKTSFSYLYQQLWGDLYGSLNNYEQSINHYEKALKAAQATPAKLFELRFVYLRMAEQYQKMTLPLKAIDAYEKYLKMISDKRKNPLSADVLLQKDDFLYKATKYRIADLYFDMKDYVRALDAYRAVLQDVKDEPFVSHSRYRMGECFLALNDRKAAVSTFELITSKDPSNLWALAAKSYVESVKMEVKYGIRIFN